MVSLMTWRATFCPLPVAAQTRAVAKNASQSQAEIPPANSKPRAWSLNDAQSLSGVKKYVPGPIGNDRSFLLPSIQFSSYADSDPYGISSGGTKVDYRGSATWSLALQKIDRKSQFKLAYAGGEIVSSRPLTGAYSSGTGKYEDFHSLTIDEEIKGARWTSSFLDEFSYLPESSFGFPGFNGLSGPGANFGAGYGPNGNPINPALIPNQSILTGSTRRLSNVAVAEIGYSITPRSSVSASEAYGLLHYVSSGFINTIYSFASVGYNHVLTRRDEAGLSYSYNDIRFGGLAGNIAGHSVQVTYGKQFTDALSLNLSAGPLVNVIRQPLGDSVTRIFFSTDDSLRYQLHRGRLHLDYIRYTSPGAGVLFGAETDQITGGLDHQVSRRFNGAVSAGYAWNKSLAGRGGVIPGSSFRSLEGGATLSRQLSRTMSLFVSYQIQRETADVSVCLDAQCGRTFLRHVASVGINWQGRAIAFR